MLPPSGDQRDAPIQITPLCVPVQQLSSRGDARPLEFRNGPAVGGDLSGVHAGAMSATQACKSDSVTLSPPGAADNELAATASGSAKHGAAEFALNGSLRVRENGRNFVALLADNVHEERVRRLYQSLKFVHTLLLGRIGVQKVHLHCAL